MRGTVVQINISPGGIPKRPIAEATVTPEGIAGDSWLHRRFHGGPQKALLLICAEVIDQLAADGFPVFPGALGENLTVRGLDHRQFRSGQRYRAGDVVLEFTTVRIPCNTLDVYGPAIKGAIYSKAVKAGDTSSPLWARSGFYASVVQGGVLRPGAPVTLLDQAV